MFFDVVLHLGSLLVVLTVFRKDIIAVLRALTRLDFRSEDGKLGIYIILGTAATFIIGFFFKDLFESFFQNPLAVGVAFILTGIFYSLLFIFRVGKQHSRPLNPFSAILIGTAQGVALIPGVSRSGSTIATGLLLKADKKEAFRFSFLLFVPAVVGATLVTAMDAGSVLFADVDAISVLLGFVATVVIGYFSLKLLLRIVLRERLYLFAYYCWALGAILVLTYVLRP